MPAVLVVHGPNMNMLGRREKTIYGDMNYDTLNEEIKKKADHHGFSVAIRQSNHEGELVDIIQGASETVDLILINPGAYTHTSVAIRDALLAVGLPVIEVHMSNIHKREPFRQQSYVSDISIGSIIGFGPNSYLLGLDAAAIMISNLTDDS